MKSLTPSPVLRFILFAALPQETALLMRKTGPWSRLIPSPCSAWKLEMNDRSLLLLQTGMGASRLPGLFKWATALSGCDLIVSLGFGGGLTPELQVGDLCLCDRFCRWNPEKRSIDSHGLAIDGRGCEQVLQTIQSARTCIDVTTPGVASKGEIGRQLGSLTDRTPALVDMESYALAELAREASIPLVTLRSISDALGEELDFDLASIADGHGNIRVCQLAATVLRRPGLIPSFLRLWRDSRTAARSLGEAAAALVSLPSEQIRTILKTSRVAAWGAGTQSASEDSSLQKRPQDRSY